MPTAYIDRVDTLSAKEHLGVIRSMARKARVLFRPDEVPRADNQNPHTILELALNACPKSMSTLADLGYENLVLTDRDPALAENEPTCVDVTLTYNHILDGPNQQLRSPPRGILFGKGRCSITEKTTNFYYQRDARGEIIRNPGDGVPVRVQILTAHSFPRWDMGLAGLPLNPGLPLTVVQGGDVTLPFPGGNFTLNGILATNNPWDVAWRFIACTNKIMFANQPVHTWLCTEVQWDILDRVRDVLDPDDPRATYRFGFEFQYNIDTWNPTVAFNDQRTGRPPAYVKEANIRADDDAKQEAIAFPGIQAQAAAAAAIALGQGPVAAGAAAALAFARASEGIKWATITPADNVLRLNRNPYNNALQPAGVWTVPALREIDFAAELQTTFEGEGFAGQILQA